MAETFILRNESELPADVRALLHAPPPDGVWHLPSHPRIGNPFRFGSNVSLALLIVMLGLFAMTVYGTWGRGMFRSEGFVITLGLMLCAAGVHWVSRRATAKAKRLEADLEAGRMRFGLWLTPQHVLVRDSEEISCARREDIVKTHFYHAGGGRPALLVLTLRDGQQIRIIVAALDGWAGQGERLREELEKRLSANPGITAEEMQHASAFHLPHMRFSEFIRELDDKAQRLKSGTLEKDALLAMAETALASWPDKARSADDEWSMLTEINSTYEYGGAQAGRDKSYHGFKKESAHWLLPLCRTVHFHEAESIFPNVASVQDCAAVFHDVPLTIIEFTGGMDDCVFDAFLAWAATKPLKTLAACNYSTDRGSVSNLRDHLRKRLAEFKQQRQLA